MATLRELITRITFTSNLAPLEKVARGVDAIRTRINLLVGVEAFKAFNALREQFGNFALDLRNLSEATGLSTTEFQKLAYAAAQSGVSQEDLGRSLGTLNKKLQAARLGSEEAALAFARAGITPEQLGSFKNAEEAFFALGRSLNNIADPVLRASAAQETLGESSTRMLGGLKGGQHGIEALSKSADASANVLSAGLIENLIRSEQALQAVGRNVKTLGAQLMGMLAPALTESSERMSKFLIANNALIKTTFKRWFYNVTYVMGYAQGVIEDVSLAVIQLTRYLYKLGSDTGIFSGIAIAGRIVWALVSALFNRIWDLVKGVGISIAYLASSMVEAFRWLNNAGQNIPRLFEDIGKALTTGAIGAILRLVKAFGELALGLATLDFHMFTNGIREIITEVKTLWDMLKAFNPMDTALGRMLAATGSLLGSKLFGNLEEGFAFHRRDKEEADFATSEGLAAVRQYMSPVSPFGAQSSMTSAGATNTSSLKVQTNAPITINIRGEANSEPVLRAVQEGVASHYERVLNQALAQAPQATVY